MGVPAPRPRMDSNRRRVDPVSHGKDAGRDIQRGRRGGGWVPAGKEPTSYDRPCSVCRMPMVGGQDTHHATCTPDPDPGPPPEPSLFD
jgi:hypothetical protein